MAGEATWARPCGDRGPVGCLGGVRPRWPPGFLVGAVVELGFAPRCHAPGGLGPLRIVLSTASALVLASVIRVCCWVNRICCCAVCKSWSSCLIGACALLRCFTASPCYYFCSFTSRSRLSSLTPVDFVACGTARFRHLRCLFKRLTNDRLVGSRNLLRYHDDDLRSMQCF